ncbi:primase-helicase family protein [Raoultella sp. BAC10a-01-01]|uniref:Primase-helicase family protein n=1 Tax=Raoultella scottii TaxID=3040937 RepID=A0ABU8Z7F0_9ENTR
MPNPNNEKIIDNAANDSDVIYIDEKNGHERLAHQFAEYLINQGFIYLSRKNGADLYSTLTGKFHPFHAETNLYQQWLRKQSEHRRSGHNPLLHDILRQRIKYASAREFIPGGARPLVYEADGVPVLNTWKPYEPQTTAAAGIDLSLWTEYLERLFPDADERHTVVQWLAHMFQHPEVKPSWHLMLTSATGTGKGFLFDQVLSPLLCGQASLLSSYDKLTGQFSTVIANNLLVFLDDCRSSSKSLHTRLKSLLTERRQQIEEKQEQARMVSTYTRFILASNERRPIRFSPNERERRWFVVRFMEHRHNPEETGEFIGRLAQWLTQDGSLDAIYWWLMACDLTGFNPHHCRATETLAEMQEQSRSMLDIGLSDWLESNRVFKMETVRLLFDAPADLIKHRLEELGFRQSRINTNGAGVDRSRYWFPADWKPKQAAQWLEDAADGTTEQF